MDHITSEVLNKAQKWANDTFLDVPLREEVQELISHSNYKEIQERFYKDLEFGTGGMRSILGAGINRINKFTIRKASYALGQEVLRSFSDREKIVAISYDSRKFSYEFAKESACVLAATGLKVIIYKRMNPVALLSFLVRYKNACAGIMITASHNPPEYNGFKVFWEDGAQVTPPNDQNIIEYFNKISDFSEIPYLDFEKGVDLGHITWAGEEVESAYLTTIKQFCLRPELCQKRGKNLKIAYTPIHGTGLIPCKKALEQIGFSNIEIVEEQAKADPNFSTVTSPNPENPSALKLCVDLMLKTHADMAIGSDPDADRIGVALPYKGEIYYLNGNQMGVLMLHYILSSLKKLDKIPANPYFVKTIVTTDLQKAIADSFNVTTEETLTGFKWICRKVRDIEKNNPERSFIFGTEESFGYLNHNSIRDKDGVSPVALLAEMALYYKEKGLNLIDALDNIYTSYGFYHESLLSIDYEGKEGQQKITRIMDHFRSSHYEEILEDKVYGLYDYKNLIFKKIVGEEEKIEGIPSSNVLGLIFDSGNKIFLRPSGTEPKIKFYIMIRENSGALEEKKKKAEMLSQKIIAFIKETVKKL